MVVYPSKKRYDAENVVRVTVAFNRNTDPEATEFIEHKERCREEEESRGGRRMMKGAVLRTRPLMRHPA